MRFSKRFVICIPKSELQFEIEKLYTSGDVVEYAYILHELSNSRSHYHVYLEFVCPVTTDDVCKLFDFSFGESFCRDKYTFPVSWTTETMLEAFLLKDRHNSYDSSLLKASIGLHEKYPEIFRK